MGKNKYIETPEKLWELFTEYVIYEQENPMTKREYVGRNGDAVDTPLETPITFDGFECYLADMKIIEHLSDYAANTNGVYDDYSTIITRIRKNCFVHNFKGASVGLFNPSLIARKLGLTDKQEIKTEEKVTELNINVIKKGKK